MTTATLQWTGRLVVTTCWCGIGHAVPKDLYRHAQQKENFSVYCPLGHEWVIREPESAQLKRQLEWARDSAAAARARADQAEASLRTTKGHVTRLRRKVLAGECPFCGQHLRDLERHIGRQHPDESPDLVEESVNPA